ncbi:MAG: iron-sulfur cluster-binding protein, partial [Bryobacterales bacterium]|nr:iron-sulfur cluster-binding protein [Bryobacterales bacterium]
DGHAPLTERVAMKAAAFLFGDAGRLEMAQKVARIGQKPFEHDGVIDSLPGMLAGWTSVRDLMPVPKQSFREWWSERK